MWREFQGQRLLGQAFRQADDNDAVGLLFPLQLATAAEKTDGRAATGGVALPTEFGGKGFTVGKGEEGVAGAAVLGAGEPEGRGLRDGRWTM